jgi:hypothetical protein
MRKRQAIMTPSGYQIAHKKEFQAAVRTLLIMFPRESKREIERVTWALVMARPNRRAGELVSLAASVLRESP